MVKKILSPEVKNGGGVGVLKKIGSLFNIYLCVLVVVCVSGGCAPAKRIPLYALEEKESINVSGDYILTRNLDDLHKTYLVRKLKKPILIDADWDKPQWQDIEPLDIALHMGEKPQHFPDVQAKIAYDRDNIYVIFRVDDNYIKASALNHQTRVSSDSCVEFFFTPSDDISTGYMNLETNCLGKMLFRFQEKRGVGGVLVREEDIAGIEIAHSLPYDIITEEIQTPTVCTIEYRLPLAVVENYISVNRPSSGVKWRANLYKCADETSRPHWLTWSFIPSDRPQFHLPEYFGTLVFE